MNTKILNYGSLNIDYVYKTPHIVKPGETLASRSLTTYAGGKGANQSTALARAGAAVYHAGKVGKDGLFLKENLRKEKVDVTYVHEGADKNGHASIQVDDKGQNAIILFSGSNKEITKEEIDEALSHFQKGDFLLLQNEINFVDYLIEAGHQRGLYVCLNPAPMSEEVLSYPLHYVNSLIVNETEAKALAHKKTPSDALEALDDKYPETEIIITLGDEGVLYRFRGKKITVPAKHINVVDTTGAGDTFIGYYLAAKLEGQDPKSALEFASKASALCVSKPGAQDSIPRKEELLGLNS